MASPQYTKAKEAAEFLNNKVPKTIPPPQIGIICGSGLSDLVSTFQATKFSIPYSHIPGFAEATVSGHQNRLVFGTLGKKKTGIVAMVGRLHFYEGHDMETVTFPIRVFHQLGVETIIGIYLVVFY